ncbi:MAG: Lrp/AsnC family transcriptional regulator [Deltaproteobacteria bacterium]|nr:Lrp/AsnC family transcriptional regulator [Deltaproteobacteria bacterium]
MISELDKKIIGLIQGDLPLETRPFASMAEIAGVNEDQFIRCVEDLRKRGVLRRFGATLSHYKSGFRANAMVAWIVPDERVDKVGRLFSSFKEVTHCYQRNAQNDWPYNLFTMVHGSSRDQCFRIAEKMADSACINEYILLFSEKEFKKTSMKYF